MLKEGDKINLYGIDYEVSYNGRFLNIINNNNNINDAINDAIFNKLALNKQEFTKSVLGYCDKGIFPVCKNLEDLNKLVNALKKEIMKQDKWCVKVTKENAAILGEFYAKHSYKRYREIIPNQFIGKYVTSHNIASKDSIFSKNNGSNFDLEEPNKTFPGISFEEFTNKYLTNKEMKSYTIKSEEAKEIFDTVIPSCSWKKRLAELWGSHIMLGKDIIITEEFLQEGLEDANTIQKQLINKYVLKEITYSWDDLEYGQAIHTTNNRIIAKVYLGWVDLNDMIITFNKGCLFRGKLVTPKITVE